jgi:hypothetical protein
MTTAFAPLVAIRKNGSLVPNNASCGNEILKRATRNLRYRQSKNHHRESIEKKYGHLVATFGLWLFRGVFLKNCTRSTADDAAELEACLGRREGRRRPAPIQPAPRGS